MRHLGTVVLACFTLFVAGCQLDGDVLINTANGDLAQGPEDLAIPQFDLAGGCGLNTCQSMGATCGPIGDGCGGVINCGTCMGHETCGGGGTPFQCGGMAGCIPLTCTALGLGCGMAGDGCGGTINCDPAGGCPGGQTCGGAGVNGQCGTKTTSSGVDMAGGLCVPKTCAQLNANCGQIGDGCGNLITCGPNAGNCTGTDTCGGAGVPFQCGHPPCVPKTCAMLGVSCGIAGDGCGGIAKDAMGNSTCGSCASGSCGGGGVAGQCGSTACTAQTCAMLGKNCGQVGDGCGGIAKDSMGNSNCGSCTSPQACGASGTANVCGTPACTPKTCAMLGYNCGQAGDGCGGIAKDAMGNANCGSCATGQVCGLLAPNQCGNQISGTSACDMGQTTISGTVVAPTDCSAGFCKAGQTAGDPIYNATVFIPSGSVTAVPVGVPACDQCSAQTPALVKATTGIDGKFTLVNPPIGAQTVVIQLGRWRRVLHINVAACVDNPLTTAQTRLPRIQGGHTGADDPMDNIPQFAISTGDVDALECVLRKMGIADTEFTNPGGGGRVQLYRATPLTGGNGAPGACIKATATSTDCTSTATPDDSSLWGTQTAIDGYDAVLFPCTGGEDTKSTAAQDVVTNYANTGGRIFTTHYSYVWTYNTYNNTTAKVPWGCGSNCNTNNHTIGKWHVDTQYSAQFQGFIDQTFPKGVALQQWLANLGVGASTMYGAPAQTGYSIPVNVVRKDIDSLMSSAQQWMFSSDPPNSGPTLFPLHLTFNTDVTKPAAQQCGRVVYSDFHVENISNGHNSPFPSECGGNSPLTEQERLLEFMLFDLTSCVQPDVPTCTPKTCAQQSFTCGLQGDTCGGIALNSMGTMTGCGTCGSGQVCTNGTCTGGCVPKTCAQLGATCGSQGDGCGGIALNSMGMAGCGTCGGGGVPNQCGGGCVKLTCGQLGLNCGPAGDGCGGLIMNGCGTCPMGQSCGGGGMPGVCGTAPDGGVMCQPLTCAAQGLMCGAAGDGCGNLLDCGPCPTGQTCGGGGTPGQCGAPNCNKTTCAAQNADCGTIGDGCGGTIDCGKCVAPQVCGGGGVPFKCGILL
jgi:hypothetical protein